MTPLDLLPPFLSYRSPKFFSHGGLYIRFDGKWYRLFKIGPK